MTNVEDIEILLVEDNPNDVELALRALKKHNLANHVHVAEDGVAALDFLFGTDRNAGIARHNGPRVVFLDLKLPKVDGREVLKAIREDPRTRTLPVVVLTSSQEESDILAAYQLGVNSFLVKPIGFEGFVRAVAEAGFYWLVLNKPPFNA